MVRKFWLMLGFALGYVLGARAGKERYEEIVSMYRDFCGRPEVVSAASAVKEQVSDLADSAKEQVTEKVSSLRDESVGDAEPAPVAPVTETSSETLSR